MLKAFAAFVIIPQLIAMADNDTNLTDLSKIRGTWEITSEVYSGVADGLMSKKGLLVVFSQDKMATSDGKKKVDAVAAERGGESFSIDSTKTPKQMNWWCMVQDIKLESHGIYSLEGDTMHICFVVGTSVEPMPPRPVKMESPKGSYVYLWTLSRRDPTKSK